MRKSMCKIVEPCGIACFPLAKCEVHFQCEPQLFVVYRYGRIQSTNHRDLQIYKKLTLIVQS